ncbi:testis-specific serine/threonine-protein kinase 5-like isoform X2 [Felis catus]|uniref:testis-specific serine/threonine-protein kinase 5-like isoform X2 n=1 Tax=Felis catus TaxID=9685 RepID=UPI001D1A2FE7|nr:testis-specific serine/threonine-protein kinase 5-like isoform X2 [Felis catus]
MEQVRECRDNGYLLSSRKIGSGAFSKVYLACATCERMQHAKLASDPRGKHHAMGLWSTHNGHPPPLRVAIKIISTAEAPVEFSQKFLPREISSLNATYKHLNVVQLYETYQNSQRSYLVLELAARGDLLEHINWVSERRCSPGLDEEEARRLFWQLVSAVAHCRSSGIVHRGIILYAMVTGKLPFKEHQTHRMLHLMHHGPIFRLGMSPECRDLIRGLLQLRPCARLGLQQLAAHCWMLPATHALSGTTLRMPPVAEKPAKLEHSEPGRDSEPPRRRPRHCFRASAWAAEADPRGAGSAQLGLWSARTASLGVGASR